MKYVPSEIKWKDFRISCKTTTALSCCLKIHENVVKILAYNFGNEEHLKADKCC